MKMMNKSHRKILGIVHVIYGSMAIIMALMIILVTTIAGLILWPTIAKPILLAGSYLPVSTIIMISLLVYGALVLLAGIPGLIGGIGLLYGHSWAKTLLKTVGAVNFLLFPLGTILGYYTFRLIYGNITEPVL